MDDQTEGWMDGWMNRLMDGQINEWMDGYNQMKAVCGVRFRL